MNIWIEPINLDIINQVSKNTMIEYLEIQFIEIGDDYLKATMPVTERTRQPLKLLNGGASCALAESVASTAANFCVDTTQYYCVGLDINANHLRPVRQGLVTAIAKPFHLGHRTQVWGINIYSESNKQVCVARLTIAILKKSNGNLKDF